MVIKVLLIQIEGNLIDNIVIKDNELFFTETINGQTVYRYKPCSKYRYDTDSYRESMTLLFHPDYLNFISPNEIERFKNTVLIHDKEMDYMFKYNDLNVIITPVDDTDITLTD